MPSSRAVTGTIRRRFSRVISDGAQPSTMRREPAERHQRAGRRAQAHALERVLVEARAIGPAHAHRHQAIVLGQRRRLDAEQHRRAAARRSSCVVSPARPAATGSIATRRSGEQATCPSNKSTRPGMSPIACRDAQRLAAQLRLVVAEQLDLDRLGVALEIAEHVLQELDQLDAHARKARGDLLAYALHDLVDAVDARPT